MCRYDVYKNNKLGIIFNNKYFYHYMMKISSYLNNIIQSLTINWKSWLCIHISLYLINDNSLFIGYINYFIILLFSYWSHYLLHWKYIYPLNIIHIYHHLHSNTFSHIIQIILEFVSLMFFIVIKHIFMYGKIETTANTLHLHLHVF